MLESNPSVTTITDAKGEAVIFPREADLAKILRQAIAAGGRARVFYGKAYKAGLADGKYPIVAGSYSPPSGLPFAVTGRASEALFSSQQDLYLEGEVTTPEQVEILLDLDPSPPSREEMALNAIFNRWPSLRRAYYGDVHMLARYARREVPPSVIKENDPRKRGILSCLGTKISGRDSMGRVGYHVLPETWGEIFNLTREVWGD